MAHNLSMIVFAPGFPKEVPADQRCNAVTDILTLCDSNKAKGLPAAMNNSIGQQILKAARAKCDQLAQSLERYTLLPQLWKDAQHATGSLKAVKMLSG